MKYKFIHGILLVIIAQLAISVSAIANPSIVLEASSDQVDIGDELTLQADVAEISNLFAVSFELEYDPSLVEVGDISAGNFLGNDIIFFSMPGDGFVTISMTKKAGSAEASGNGTLVELKFKGIKQGEVKFNVKEETLALAQFDGNDVPEFDEIEVVPPTITVGSVEELTFSAEISPVSIPADGSSSANITATLVSSSGSPQSGKVFQIAIEQGSGQIQNKQDNGDGTYTATYISSEQFGNVVLKVTLGEYSKDISINLTEVIQEQEKPNISLTSEIASAHIMDVVPMKMSLIDDSGIEVTMDTSITIDLESDSDTGEFSLWERFSPTVTSATMRPGTSSVDIYYRDIEPGEVTVTASSADIPAQSLTLTIETPTLSIIHEPIDFVEIDEDIRIIANVTGDPKPTKLTISYRKPSEDNFLEIDMEDEGGGRWESFLPPGASSNTVGIIYYMKAFIDELEIATEQEMYGIPVNNLELTDSIPAASYKIMSMPLVLDNADPASSLQSSLGEQTSTTWRVFGYDSISESYLENQTLALGRGYWIFSSEAADIDMMGRTINPSEEFAIPLVKGWNLVGNPYAFDVYWGNMTIGVDGAVYGINDSEANQYIRQRYWWYGDASPDSINNGIFSSAAGPFGTEHILQPWHGYAVYALEACDLVISPSKNKPQESLSVIQAPGKLWQVQLTAQSGNMIDPSNYFGISTRSSDYYDRCDSEKPPFPSDEVSVSFPHPDWGKDSNRYAEDYKSPFFDEKNWHVSVVSKSQEAAVKLHWDGVSQIPSYFNAYLIDKAAGTAIDMRRDSVYTYWSEYGRDDRKFQILVTRREIETRSAVPSRSVLLQNYPNPFNPETWIPYSLSEGNSVIIRIYGVSGQLIRTLDLGHKHAGYYESKNNAAYWDGLNEYGEQISSGLYFYTIQAGHYTATKKMTVAR